MATRSYPFDHYCSGSLHSNYIHSCWNYLRNVDGTLHRGNTDSQSFLQILPNLQGPRLVRIRVVLFGMGGWGCLLGGVPSRYGLCDGMVDILHFSGSGDDNSRFSQKYKTYIYLHYDSQHLPHNGFHLYNFVPDSPGIFGYFGDSDIGAAIGGSHSYCIQYT